MPTSDGRTANVTSIVFHPDSWVARMQLDGKLDETNVWAHSVFTAVSQVTVTSPAY